MLSDLRFAFRSLLKTPGFTAIALLTLALGIGVNTSMFSVLNALLLHSPLYPEPDRLLRVYRSTPSSQLDSHSAPNFLDLQARTKSFEHLAAFARRNSNLAEPGQPAEPLPGLGVSGDFFATLGVQPLLGRTITAEDDRDGAERVVVLTEPFWRQRFASDPGMLGRQIRLDGNPVTVIGVMPAGTEDRLIWGGISLWRPLAFDKETLESRGGHWLSIIGRLRSGVDSPAALSELGTHFADLARAHPEVNSRATVQIAPFVRSMQDDKTRVLSLFSMGLAGCVMLIACVNLANLLFARNVLRTREHAIRAALGATRGRLIRQSLTESLLLALVGGALGLFVAVWSNAALGSRLMVGGQPFTLGLDWDVAGFAFVVATVSAAAFGLLPALLVSRTDVNDALKQGARGSTSGAHHRLRQGLIVVEIALALVLLSGAGFFSHGLDRFLTRDQGWQPAGLLTARIRIPVAKYPNDAAITAFHERLKDRLAALPGVEQVSLSRTLPFYGFGWGQRYIIEGRAPLEPGTEPLRDVNLVSPDYFQTLGITLLAGRTFTPADLTGPMRTVIAESMARSLWPGESALGKRIAHPLRPTEWQEVVGVVRDVRFASNLENPANRFQTYRLLGRETDNDGFLAFRSSVPPSTLADAVRQTIASLDHEVSVQNILPATQLVAQHTANYTLISWILAGFAGLGLLLATIGLYGLISGQVAERTNEIGIRMALGADLRAILRLVLGRGLRLTALGVVLGLAGSWWVATLLRSIIPALPAAEPGTALLITVVLLATAILACWLPARRAARIDPLTAIRAE